MFQNSYLLKEVPESNEEIYESTHPEMPGAQTRLRGLSQIISEIRHIDYQFDPLLPMTAGEYHDIYVHDYKSLIDANIYENVSHNVECRFILLNYDFVYNQFFAIVSKFPGNVVPIVITDTIIELIYEYYEDGLAIEFLRDPERFGALPVGIFQDQEEILAFYGGIRALYEGEPAKYLEVVGKYWV